jgi:citrate lyase subunit beta/citryl-CoA lyase
VANGKGSLAIGRSLLFVAADDADAIDEALRTPADAVVADLEDSVPQSRKDAARTVLADFLAGPRSSSTLFVRVNALDTPHASRDLELVRTLRPEAVLVPKATPEAVTSLDTLRLPLVAIVESAAGLRLAYEIAATPGVVALALGANDLASALGLENRSDALELLYARSKLVADSAAAGLRGPFDRVYRLDDAAGLAADARLARSLGFRGKSALRHDQIDLINDVFAAVSPTGGAIAATAAEA